MGLLDRFKKSEYKASTKPQKGSKGQAVEEKIVAVPCAICEKLIKPVSKKSITLTTTGRAQEVKERMVLSCPSCEKTFCSGCAKEKKEEVGDGAIISFCCPQCGGPL